MGNHGCNNGTLDDSKYSSPVPLIGLYIAAASLVCMLLMLYDIIAGFHNKKRWLPCKLFKLNSITLTLLSIAAKLPVDLTTSMPSAQDQLSKLSGTTLICISMGFLLPSIGINRGSECLANMSAMSIFVITVIVNICLQISTGVIVLFIKEHIIILCCMLVLLMMMWYSVYDINGRKGVSINQSKSLLAKGEKSMVERLKLCYLSGYSSNPQLVVSKHPICPTIGMLCILCSIVLIQAVFKSIVLKQLSFCIGVSDYGWSMRILVLTQIITVVVGCFATTFRWITLFKHMKTDWLFDVFEQNEYGGLLNSPILGDDLGFLGEELFVALFVLMVFFVQLFMVAPLFLVHYILKCMKSDSKTSDVSNSKFSDIGTIEEFQDQIHKGDMELDEWTIRKGLEEMKRWMKVSKSKSPIHLSELLSRRRPSEQVHTMKLRDLIYPDQEGIEVSSLSIVLLVRIAQVSIPQNLNECLVKAFTEAYDIIHFVDNIRNSLNLKNAKKLVYAKAVWIGDDFNCLLPKIFEKNTGLRTTFGLRRAVGIITELKNILPSDFVWDELGIIVDFINRRRYSSINDLYECMEQLFVDLLHLYFSQLPNAIFKQVIASHAEEYEEKVRVAMNFLYKIQSLEDHIQWSFPKGCNISRLITSGGSTTLNQNQTV